MLFFLYLDLTSPVSLDCLGKRPRPFYVVSDPGCALALGVQGSGTEDCAGVSGDDVNAFWGRSWTVAAHDGKTACHVGGALVGFVVV